jgi:hypothetical protein
MHPSQVPEQYRLAYLRHQHGAIQKLNSLLTNQQMLAAAGIAVDPNTYTMTQKTLQARQGLFQTAFAMLQPNVQQLFLQQVQQQQQQQQQLAAATAQQSAAAFSNQTTSQQAQSMADFQLELQRRAAMGGRGKK